MTLLDAMGMILSIFTMPFFFALLGIVAVIAAVAMIASIEPYAEGLEVAVIVAVGILVGFLGAALLIWALSSSSPFEWVP